ncbi:outer membrane beta-barrel protein [Vibrio marisflavi]|uniref:Outer membrane protein beta-barrel domain-containing protein n=1 Tax=Vibrio marisflavi CECT 7928 TaxID=634439 RepID=A0ABM9A4C3_9VIBR|nr:outer membrane beta-barrel protein [Vibrio marisflavi]CAH0539652.1 hypothetical protein VMF7928_02329 [Vibrio marisflavi CECT 7928]
MRKALIIGLAVASFGANAAEFNPYVNGHIGVTNNDNVFYSGTYATSTDDTGLGVSVGALTETAPQVQAGFEGSINYLGSANIRKRSGSNVFYDTVNNYAYDAAGVMKLDLNPAFYVIGKAGLSLQVMDDANFGGTNTDIVPLLAAGFGVNLNQQTSVNLIATKYFGDNGTGDTGEITSLMAGIQYRF